MNPTSCVTVAVRVASTVAVFVDDGRSVSIGVTASRLAAVALDHEGRAASPRESRMIAVACSQLVIAVPSMLTHRVAGLEPGRGGREPASSSAVHSVRSGSSV